jgi:hypothetical protein
MVIGGKRGGTTEVPIGNWPRRGIIYSLRLRKDNADMKYLLAFPAALCMLSASISFAEDPYDFRKSAAYSKVSKDDRDKLERVHRDFMMLWGALDRYADHHDGSPPEMLGRLVPNYLSELPTDPFAAANTANKRQAGTDMDSKSGAGYRYRKGAAGNRAWILSSVGLPDFPYLAAHGNRSLYVCKGVWISGINPSIITKKQDPTSPISRGEP